MSDLAPCNQYLYKNGVFVGMYDTSYMGASGFERIIRAAEILSGRECDWHYAAGRAIVKALPQNVVEVHNAVEAIYTYEYNRLGPEWTKAKKQTCIGGATGNQTFVPQLNKHRHN